MSTNETETRFEELTDSMVSHDERLDAIETRLDRLEKHVLAGKAQAILAARTLPASPEMSATGRSPNPEKFDSQEALLRSRSGDRHEPRQRRSGRQPLAEEVSCCARAHSSSSPSVTSRTACSMISAPTFGAHPRVRHCTTPRVPC
jgi:hypothetical protein